MTAPIETLVFELVGIETPPLDAWHDAHEVHEFIINYYRGLPEPWTTALAEVVTAHNRCRCWDCGEIIGYHLDARDVRQWRPVFLVRYRRGPVAWLCEDCTPQLPPVRWEKQTHS